LQESLAGRCTLVGAGLALPESAYEVNNGAKDFQASVTIAIWREEITNRKPPITNPQ
jgi:hypothetical protein